MRQNWLGEFSKIFTGLIAIDLAASPRLSSTINITIPISSTLHNSA